MEVYCSPFTPVKERHRILYVSVDSVHTTLHPDHLLFLHDFLIERAWPILVVLKTQCVDSINKIDSDSRLEGAMNADWMAAHVGGNEGARQSSFSQGENILELQDGTASGILTLRSR